MNGHIYILDNPALRRGFFKIGLSTTEIGKRASGLSKSSSIPMNFNLRYSTPVSDVKTAERRVHLMLDEFRVSPRKEFFRLSLTKAKQVCEAIASFELEDSSMGEAINLHRKLLGARYGEDMTIREQILLYSLMGATANQTRFDHLTGSRRGIVDGFLTGKQLAVICRIGQPAARKKFANLAARGQTAICSTMFDGDIAKVFDFIRYHKGHLAWRFTDEFRKYFWNDKI